MGLKDFCYTTCGRNCHYYIIINAVIVMQYFFGLKLQNQSVVCFGLHTFFLVDMIEFYVSADNFLELWHVYNTPISEYQPVYMHDNSKRK